MTKKANVTSPVRAIEARGLVVVYPVQNRADPPSLWAALHPNSEMRWAWDESADPRVAALWHLREELSVGRRVVYGKWLGGRAMFASKEVFGAMLAKTRRAIGSDATRSLSRDAARLLEVLEDDSPQATRSLRNAAELTGRALEPVFVKAMRELWERMLIVGAGEEAEGGFPSLSVGATSLLFEDLWDAAAPGADIDEELLASTVGRSPSLSRAFAKNLVKIGR